MLHSVGFAQSMTEIIPEFEINLRLNIFYKQRHRTVSDCLLTLILPRKFRLLYFSFATNFKVLQSHSKLVKILSEYQTARLLMRRRVTRGLIRIQAVCIWDYGRDRQDKGFYDL